MKKGLLFILVLMIAFMAYWFGFKRKGPSTPKVKAEPIVLKKHSESFNNSIDKTMNAYLSIKDAFIEDDTAGVKKNTGLFISLLDSIPLDELKNDNASIIESARATIGDIKSNAVSLMAQTQINEMRQDFRMVTEMMYPSFFKTINYEGPKLYLENCPMAFGENNGADWISNNPQIMNPYLGKHHPEYKSSMLHCGEVKDTIKAQ